MTKKPAIPGEAIRAGSTGGVFCWSNHAAITPVHCGSSCKLEPAKETKSLNYVLCPANYPTLEDVSILKEPISNVLLDVIHVFLYNKTERAI